MDGEVWTSNVPGCHCSGGPYVTSGEPHKLQVYPSGHCVRGRGWIGCRVPEQEPGERRRGGDPLPPAVSGAAKLLFILRNRLSNDKSFEKQSSRFNPNGNFGTGGLRGTVTIHT